MDILYLLQVLWRKKWLIIVTSVVSTVLAFFLTRNLPVKYTSESRISTGFTTGEGINVTNERFNPRLAGLKFDNLLILMRSSIVYNFLSYRLAVHDIESEGFRSLEIDDINELKEIDLVKVSDLFKGKLESFSPLTPTEENADLLRKVLQGYGYGYNFVKEGLNVRRVANTDYVEVTFTSNDPQLSAFAVNAFCDEFLRYYSQTKVESGSESVSFFDKLVIQKKEELDEKSEALKSFKTNNSFLNFQSQGENQIGQVTELETQKSEIESTLYSLKLKLDNLKSRNVNTSRSGGSQVDSNRKILSLRRQISDLNSRYLAGGSSDLGLKDSLDLLRSQLNFQLALIESAPDVAAADENEDVDQEIQNTEIEIAVQESRLGQVDSKLYNLRTSLSGFASKEAVLTKLQRDVEVATNEYLNAQKRYNESQNKLKAATESIKQVYLATPPANPESSKRLIIIALSGIVVFGLGVFLILAKELLDDSIKVQSQFHRIVNLPLAGTIMKVNVKNLNYSSLFSKKQEDPVLESFKHFLRKIRFELENTSARTFMITSLKNDEGKTFVVFALAFVMSLVKKKILIIDTNFKNNTLTKWLSKGKEVKLLESKNSTEVQLWSSKHKNGKETPESMKGLVSQTEYNNIYIIGNAGGYESPEEIFQERNFEVLIEKLKEYFDYILLEGPALNEYSDTKEMVKYVDKIIPIFSADSKIKQQDKESIKYLNSLDGKLTGAILNQIEPENINN
ncbi:MAG: Wzz/FepE/Etk N-terminal domain-containing protein [Bacteroidota bacterium]